MLKVEPRRMYGASRWDTPTCAGSDPVLPEIVAERLRGKLFQLGQFGLAPADRPLLKLAGDESWPAGGERALGAAGGNH